MAQRNEQVQNRVREEMTRQPNLGSRELFEIVKDMDPSLEGRPLASFHASYVLPVKREQAASRAQAGAQADEPKHARPRKQTQRRGKQAAEDTAAEAEPSPAAPTKSRKQARKTSAASAASERAGGQEPAAQAQAGGQGPAGGREKIRAVFMEFAREFAEAESRTEIVQVLSKVDEYVERVVAQGS
jgi:hypothetical protein